MADNHARCTTLHLAAQLATTGPSGQRASNHWLVTDVDPEESGFLESRRTLGRTSPGKDIKAEEGAFIAGGTGPASS